MDNILKSVETIKSAESIVLTAHKNPDGDAIGSLYGLYLTLKKIGKNPIILLEEYSHRFNAIMPQEELYKGEIKSLKPELFISLDCGGIDRINDEHLEIFKKASTTINIDHHISNDSFGDINIVDVEKTSASEVVYDLIVSLCEPDKYVLEPIYAGIVFDSGGFKYSKTSSNTHDIASIAHKKGIDFNKLYTNVMGSHSLTEMSMFTRAIANMKYDLENKIIYSYITKEDFNEFNGSKDDVGGVVSYLLNTEGFMVSVFIYEKENHINKISMRSKKLDVNLVASHFGGGGHQLASGCEVSGNLFDALENVLAKVKEHIKDEKFI